MSKFDYLRQANMWKGFPPRRGDTTPTWAKVLIAVTCVAASTAWIIAIVWWVIKQF
jgi:hypothetical protein